MAYKSKLDQAAAAKRHYLKNKERVKKRSILNKKKTVAALREKILNHLLKNPCVDCGNTDVEVLEFDHVRGKKVANISDIVASGAPLKLDRELPKCDVRCANCHRKITRKRLRELGSANGKEASCLGDMLF